MELIPRNGYLFDTTVFIDYERERPAALELIQQSRLPGVSVCYSFITYWELRLGRTDDWTDEDLYQALRPYPMIGLHPDIEKHAEIIQQEIREKNERSKNKLSLPEFNDCYIASSAYFHGMRVVTANKKHSPQFRKINGAEIPIDLYSND